MGAAQYPAPHPAAQVDWGDMAQRKRALMLHLAEKGALVATTTYRIELKLDVDPSLTDKHDIIRDACKQAAQTLLATATLISDNRRPQVAVFADDFFDGTAEIAVFDADNP
jgi:hypothetical protein